jgi:hypothetical protein
MYLSLIYVSQVRHRTRRDTSIQSKQFSIRLYLLQVGHPWYPVHLSIYTVVRFSSFLRNGRSQVLRRETKLTSTHRKIASLLVKASILSQLFLSSPTESSILVRQRHCLPRYSCNFRMEPCIVMHNTV